MQKGGNNRWLNPRHRSPAEQTILMDGIGVVRMGKGSTHSKHNKAEDESKNTNASNCLSHRDIIP